MMTFFYLHGSTGSFLVDFRQNKYCWLQKYCIAITIIAFLTGILNLLVRFRNDLIGRERHVASINLKTCVRRLESMFVLFYWLWFCGGFKLPFVWHRDEKQHWKKIVCITRWRRRAYTLSIYLAWYWCATRKIKYEDLRHNCTDKNKKLCSERARVFFGIPKEFCFSKVDHQYALQCGLSSIQKELLV